MPNLTSSVLHEVEYEDGNLAVTFVHGRRYLYRNVPRATYEQLLAAPSKDAFFNDAIRDCFVSFEITDRPGRAQ